MENNITELVYILDRSGSMAGLESDTVGGFNSMLDKQKKVDGACFVTTVLFNSKAETVHDRLPLEEVPHMTEEDFTVGGSTALLDAMGDTITHIAGIRRYLRKEDVPAHTVFVIMTDGMENASREYTASGVRKLVEQKKEEGWEFLFLGANIDAVGAAATVGISADRAVKYRSDSIGTRLSHKVVADALCSMRCGAAMEASWKDEIEEDEANRGASPDNSGNAAPETGKQEGRGRLFRRK